MDSYWISDPKVHRNEHNFATLGDRAQDASNMLGVGNWYYCLEKKVWSGAPRLVKEDENNLPLAALMDYVSMCAQKRGRH